MRVMTVLKELKHGGAETVALRIMEAGPSADQAVAAAPGEWSDRFPGRHYDLRHTSRSPVDILTAARQLRAAIREADPDVVHAHSPGTILTAALALALPHARRRRPVALLGTCHGGGDERALRRQAALYRAVRVPVVSCGPGVDAALRQGGLTPIARIDNGVPLAASEPSRPRDLAAEFGLDPAAPVVVTVGRLAAVKNQVQTLRAMVDVPGASLLVCGDGEDRPALEAEAAALGLGPRVRFLGSRRDAREIMRSADCVVQSSRVEGLPVTLLEAMAEGAPVVATSVIGTRELVTDGRDGLLVALDDEAGLARAVRRVLAEPELADRLRDGGRRTVAGYSLEEMCQRYWALYGELSASLPGRRSR